jgi:hypothetical protein
MTSLVALHQQSGLAAHLPIEELHTIGVAILRPSREACARAEEAIIVANFDRHAKLGGPPAHHFRDAPFAGLCGDDGVRRV